MKNTVCQEIYYVIKGNGILHIDNKKIELKQGDVFLIHPNKEYHVIGKNLHLALSTHPAWYPKQHKHIK